MNNTVFGKIIQGEIPATKVYEDDTFLAFLDISPVSKGHTLLIPKEHYTWIHEVPDAMIADIFVLAKKILTAQIKGLGCNFVQVGVGGNEVPHFHIHLIPRKENEDAPLSDKERFSYETSEEMQEYAQKIINAL